MWKHRVKSDNFLVEITGGSVKITDINSDELIKIFKGYNYLYTGDIRPDEAEFFALENGKHFYVYSLKDFELIKKITLPKRYESLYVNGFYSEDGKFLNIPAERYVYDDKARDIGHCEFILFKYETDNYELVEKTKIDNYKKYHWNYVIQDGVWYSGGFDKEIIF